MNGKEIAKSVLRGFSPALYHAAKGFSARAKFRRRHLARQRAMRTVLFGELPPTVMAGPFVGMKYLDEVVWGPIEPKWLGTYECELHPIFETMNIRQYSVIIDVGSAEGYYSVGLARINPDAKVFSYDIDPWARSQQRRLATLNQVENLVIGSSCDETELARQVKGPTLVICDTEGYEYELLKSEITGIEMCDFLVEVHQYGKASAVDGARELQRRFAGTHQSIMIPVTPRGDSCIPSHLQGVMSDSELLSLMDEHRLSSQLWLWLSRRRPT